MSALRGFLLGAATVMTVLNIIAFGNGGAFQFKGRPMALTLWIACLVTVSVSLAITGREHKREAPNG